LHDTFRTVVRGYEEWKISELAKLICEVESLSACICVVCQEEHLFYFAI